MVLLMAGKFKLLIMHHIVLLRVNKERSVFLMYDLARHTVLTVGQTKGNYETVLAEALHLCIYSFPTCSRHILCIWLDDKTTFCFVC